MSGCFVGPYVNAYDVPINCPVELYREQQGIPADPPRATVLRGNQDVDVTGAVEDLGLVDLGLSIYTVDCLGATVAETHSPKTYEHYKLTLSGAQVGEYVFVNAVGAGLVLDASASCPALFDPAPQPECTGMYDSSMCVGSDTGSGADPENPPPPDDGGCNAGGRAMLGTSIALLALVRRRRRA